MVNISFKETTEDACSFLFVGYLNVSLSFTLTRNEKVKQYIKKKIHKPNALRFWVEVGVIPLYGSNFCLILVCLADVSPFNFSSKWYHSQ